MGVMKRLAGGSAFRRSGLDLGIGFNVRVVFDDRKIRRAVERAERRALIRGAQYVRKVARHSLKSKRGPSRPGQPPHVHGPALKRIFYLYERGARSAFVGPERFRGRVDVPALHEHGGSIFLRRRRGRPVRVEYPARPFVRTALERSIPKLRELWRRSVKGV